MLVDNVYALLAVDKVALAHGLAFNFVYSIATDDHVQKDSKSSHKFLEILIAPDLFDTLVQQAKSHTHCPIATSFIRLAKTCQQSP